MENKILKSLWENISLKWYEFRSVFRYNKYCRWWFDFCYWVRCHTYNRYHLLDLRNEDYKWGWVDMDTAMMYAQMACLVSFVENEWDLPCIEADLHTKDKYQELKKIYDWWKTGRKAENKAYEDALDAHIKKWPWRLVPIKVENEDMLYKKLVSMSEQEKQEYDTIWSIEKALLEKDTEMMKKLVDLRYIMWS